MKISVRDAFSSHTYHKEYVLDFKSEDFSDLPYDAECEDVRATVIVSSESGVVTCEISVFTTFNVVCSRCAKQFLMPLSFKTKKLIRREQCEDFEDVIYTDSNHSVDLTEEIRTQIYFEFPAKPLCDEDCKGLCPVCGCDLNVKSCSCDIRTTDPRLAVLKKLIDK